MDQQLGAEAFCVYDEAARAIWSQTDDFTNDAIARDFDGCEMSWFGERAGRSRRHQERARGRCAAQEVASAKPGTRVPGDLHFQAVVVVHLAEDSVLFVSCLAFPNGSYRWRRRSRRSVSPDRSGSSNGSTTAFACWRLRRAGKCSCSHAITCRSTCLLLRAQSKSCRTM